MSRRLLTPAEVEAELPPTWTAQARQIQRVYPFETYRVGVAFSAALAADAEAHDHHPELLLRYRDVTVTYWTHDRGGVTRLDLEAAARADALYAAPRLVVPAPSR